MSVRLEGTIKRFIGLSTDDKPSVGVQLDGTTVEARDLPAGSSFLEEDTGRIARFDGTRWWVIEPHDDQSEYQQFVLMALASIREVLVEGFA